MQVLISLTDPTAFAGMTAVYRRFSTKPYPNWATADVAGLIGPGAVIAIVAYAHLKRG